MQEGSPLPDEYGLLDSASKGGVRGLQGRIAHYTCVAQSAAAQTQRSVDFSDLREGKANLPPDVQAQYEPVLAFCSFSCSRCFFVSSHHDLLPLTADM
jgi:hypothetical protein